MTRNRNRSTTPLVRVMTHVFKGHGDSKYIPQGGLKGCLFCRGPYISLFGGFKHHLFGP